MKKLNRVWVWLVLASAVALTLANTAVTVADNVTYP